MVLSLASGQADQRFSISGKLSVNEPSGLISIETQRVTFEELKPISFAFFA